MNLIYELVSYCTNWCETAFVLNDNVEIKIPAHFNEFVNINCKKLNEPRHVVSNNVVF